MTFLPIVTRELRVRARAAGTYRVRLGAGGGAVLIVAGMLILGWLYSARPTMGEGMFATLAWLSFFFCLLEGLRNTADCLSEEKREGTLGLLFLTDLNGFDVVLGKLIATSLNSFYGLLAIFPALAIPLLLGGVTGGEFARLAVALPLALLFSLSVGLFVSAISRDAQKAWTATAGLLLIFLAVLPGLDALLGLAGRKLFLSRLSPLTPFLSVWDNPSSGSFWPSVGLVLLVCVALLAAASWILPRAWQERPVEENKSVRRPVPSSAESERERDRRAELLHPNPVVWLASRHETIRRDAWIIVSVAVAVGLGVWLLFPGNRAALSAVFMGAVVVHFMLAVWVASCACQSFAGARNSGALELLLATPLTEQQIIHGHHRALRRIFGPPVKALLAVEAVILIGQWVYTDLSGGPDAVFSFGFVLLIAVGFIGMFLTDLQAAGWVGLWYGLVTPRPAHAVAKTVLHVLVLPTLLLLCCYVFWPVMALVKNQILANWAEGRLTREFRSIVTGRFTENAPRRAGEDFSRAKPGAQLPPVVPR